MPLEGVVVAQLTEKMMDKLVGRGGIEPPTPGFSVRPTGPEHAPPSSDIFENQGDSEP
jgi:hypothetical protein